MVLRTIAVLLLAAALAASPQVLPIGTAYACSCVQSSLDEHVERANLIVLGTVVRIDEVANEDLTDELRTNYNLTVAVRDIDGASVIFCVNVLLGAGVAGEAIVGGRMIPFAVDQGRLWTVPRTGQVLGRAKIDARHEA